MMKIALSQGSLSAQRVLNGVVRAQSSIAERLSSGQRINRASDDAAGLSIASSLKADTRIFTQGIRNLSDGISAISIATGALQELTKVQTRIVELAEQSANGTLDYASRRAVQAEVDQLTEEMNRIVSTTTFNGIKLLDASQHDGEIHLQDGYGTDGVLSFNTLSGLSNTVATGSYSGGAIQEETFVGNPWDVTAVDINNDDHLDIITYTGTQMFYMLGNGDGTFAAEQAIAPSVGTQNHMAEFVDINGDGSVDMIGSESVGSVGNLLVRLGNGDGTFTAGTVIDSSSMLSRVDINYEDLNNDGLKDISYSSVYTGDFVVHLATGATTFAAADVFAGAGVNSETSAIADLNGDGNKDVVLSSNTTGTAVQIMWGAGDGTFSSPQSMTISGSGSARWVESADFNRDGFDDLLISRWSANDGKILLSNGDGTFASSNILASQMSQITDLNEDGILDILTTDTTAGSVRTYLGNGDGTFANTSSVTIGAGAGPHGLTVGDFDEDGGNDFAVAVYQIPNGVFVGLSDTQEVSTIAYLDVSSQEAARTSLDTARSVLNSMTSMIGQLGSAESRAQTALNHAQTKVDVYEAAYARIMDTDIAHETAEYVKKNIQSQIASSVLRQSVSDFNLILKLLSSS